MAAPLALHSLNCAPLLRVRQPNLAFAVRRPSIAAKLRPLASYQGLRKCGSVKLFGEGLILVKHKHGFYGFAKRGGHRRLAIVAAVFERFTERAIKSVMFAQREAKALGGDEVATQHLLLGLIAEDRAPEGFLASGLTIEKARQAARSLLDDDDKGVSVMPDKPATDVPFSIGSKRVFEAALEHSRNMGHNYIGPEHIAIALFNVDDGGAATVLQSNRGQLIPCAATAFLNVSKMESSQGGIRALVPRLDMIMVVGAFLYPSRYGIRLLYVSRIHLGCV